ncbi:MAG: hypothetical protein U5R49_26910 [Deltaproteobacteria bacterium]|nr:hypothetical protein [Deltaproteobacteria bacterium]
MDDEFEEMIHGADSAGSMPHEVSGSGLDQVGITDPVSAYLFLSDDAQDEITGSDQKRMKCLSCGHRFMGEVYDRCPKCDRFDTEEAISVLEDEENSSCQANMRCLDCGHTFVGEVYDPCPECLSADTEQMTEENDGGYW